MMIDYRYTQDKEGYYHENLRDGAVSPRKFKKKHNLEAWIRMKFRLQVWGLLAIIAVVLGVIVQLFQTQ